MLPTTASRFPASRWFDVSPRLLAVFTTLALAAGLLVAPQISSPLASSAAAAARPSARTVAKFEANMLSVLNAERRKHGLKPLKRNAKLVKSAHRHNLKMAADASLSHRLPGEQFFSDRISSAGYHWRSAGENIGVVAQINNHGIIHMQRQMYHEQAPNNGHRVNILQRNFKAVGIDVYYDKAHKRLWFTQDYGQPAS